MLRALTYVVREAFLSVWTPRSRLTSPPIDWLAMVPPWIMLEKRSVGSGVAEECWEPVRVRTTSIENTRAVTGGSCVER